MMRIRVPILVLHAGAAGAFRPGVRICASPKDETTEQMIARAEIARPEDRPALYIEIARARQMLPTSYTTRATPRPVRPP